MTEAELNKIIQAAGGAAGSCLSNAGALLEKVTRLEAVGGYETLFTQLRSAKQSGDFRGRVLEVNFADLFVKKSTTLQYGAKQGMSGDVDFCWCVSCHQVFIEMKLLGQDLRTKEAANQQLEATGWCATHISDDTRDVARIQRDIFQKSSTKKFNANPESTWINLVAVDVSELQLGTIDIGDCLLAAGGNELVNMHCASGCQRPSVVGVFEPADKGLTAEQNDWVAKCHLSVLDAGDPHPRDYIHGVLFLFRNPAGTAALSYELSSVVVWNPVLIDATRAKQLLENFYQIVPQVKSC
jgi:hypothetical protein